MSESTVVQLARFNATQFASNSEWTTDLKESIILNQGDQVVVSKVYLDSRLNTSNNIVIPIDTPLELEFYFYYMLPPDAASVQSPPISDSYVEYALNREENPDNLELWAAPFQDASGQGIFYDGKGLDLYQGDFFTAPLPAVASMSTLTGIPEPPYKNYIKDPEQKVDINQSYAVEMPLLLTTNTNDVATSKPYTKKWSYLLKAGSYAPDELAELITRSMAEVVPDDESISNFTSYQQFGTSQPSNLNAFLTRGSYIDVVGVSVPAELDDPKTNPLVNPYIINLGQGFINYSGVLTSGLQFSSNAETPAQSPNDGYIFSNFLTDVDIPKPYLADRYKTTNTTDNPITITPIKYVAQYSITTSPYQEGQTLGQSFIMYTSPLIGCNEPSLEYNDTTQVFQFTYLHTPILELPTAGSPEAQQSSEPIEVVKICKTINIDMSNNAIPSPQYKTGNVNIAKRTRHSGVIFKSMEPQSFWQNILGFDVPNITFSEEQIFGPNRIMDFETFNRATTSGYVGIQSSNFDLNPNSSTDKGSQNLSNKNRPAYTSAFPLDQTPTNAGTQTYSQLLNSSRWFLENFMLQNQALVPMESTEPFPLAQVFNNYYEEYASASVATNPLSAISVPLSNLENSGHFLIEIVAYGKSMDFINNDTIYQIKEIVSSYYVSENSFITSPFPSSFIYSHIGESQCISSYKVRIIDPITMSAATNLGASSSVYIQVNKQLTQQSLPQPNE
jgi:hypothetical protein